MSEADTTDTTDTTASTAIQSILVVDDDSDIRDLLADYLRSHTFAVQTAENGEKMLALLQQRSFDIIILDIMMPGEDGLSLCRRLRSMEGDAPHTPVIFLTALGEATDRVVGLELGADDYVVKPFEPRELLARIRAVLRRTGKVSAHDSSDANGTNDPSGASRADSENSLPARAYTFEGWKLDLAARHLVTPENIVVNLSGAEFRLLRLFLEHSQEVLSRDFIQAEAQGRDFDRSPFDRSLDVQVCRLRARLKDNGREPRLIKTVRGDGYVFTSAVGRE